jgi:predicted small lipoprotein YifL
MRVSRAVAATVAVLTALTVSVAGCGHKPASSTASTSKSGSSSPATNTSSSAPSSSASAQPSDYTGLLIKATDINAPIQFTAGPPTNNPNGQPGAAITFSTDDNSHVIKDTIQVLADPGAATNALNAAKATQGNNVKNPITDSFNVGTGGTTVSGNSPDNSKGVLILMFTEGKSFVTLEFDGPVDSLPPQDFVTDVAQKQDAAVKKGLGG